MTDGNCHKCGQLIDIQEDRWWQHSWEENPSDEQVEEAIGDRDFRDWFRENYILCCECHKIVKQCINGEL
jgi:hypothetical protein